MEKSGIKEMKNEIELRSTEIESILKKARKDSIKVSEGLITKGEIARDELLTFTREETREDFKTRMIELDKEISDAEIKLTEDIENFSKKIEEIFA